MQIQLGGRLRELRRRDGRTQEDLAQALDVTPQAVSRWEKNICYPDISLVPSIANYFGVTIDELFGYQNNRDRKIDAIIQEVSAFQIKSRGDDAWVDECLGILRTGLRNFRKTKDCGSPSPIRCRRLAGDGTMSGCIMMKKGIFSAAMPSTGKIRTGRRRWKSVRALPPPQQIQPS